jgi:hypothetical protein
MCSQFDKLRVARPEEFEIGNKVYSFLANLMLDDKPFNSFDRKTKKDFVAMKIERYTQEIDSELRKVA